ncbi:MAG: hypothetical protein ACT6RO_19560 [Hydrogenophaga sp.]|uniref:hypothetical protein n=1 Tax=Hydrogenophaga sp. TaxID=1904254 RepID=UPI0040356AD0
MDHRDEVTKQYFDESTIEVIDDTGGEFVDWFEGDEARIARLSGAPANSTLTVKRLEEGGYMLVAVGPILAEPMVRMILQAPGEEYPSLFIVNSAFVLNVEHRRRKVGVRSLAIELLEAQKTGQFAYVEVFAIGNASTLNPDNPEAQYSGYAVWPQLGFDGEIPEGLKEASVELMPFQRVSDVLSAPDGLATWVGKGGDVRLRFDLQEGSRSWIVLNGYMADNGIKVTP